MEVILSRNFVKELRQCPLHIQARAEKFIETATIATKLDGIPNIRKLSGLNDYYRVRLGNYRIGFKFESGVMKVMCVMTIGPRGDVYNNFPPG